MTKKDNRHRKQMKRGRPTKITELLTRRVKVLLAKGLDQKTACNLVGVPYSTFTEWKKRGSEGTEPFATFFSVISRARDQHKARLTKVILDAAEGLLPRHADWKAAAWALERGWPNEFAPYDRRPIPIEPEEIPRPSVAFVLGGTGKPISFAEAQKRYANFPVIEEPVQAQVTADNDEDFRYFERHGIVRIRPEQNGDGDET